MSNPKPTQNMDVICHCTDTTEKAIKQLIDNGIETLEGISQMTGVCTGCGGCEMAVLDLIAETNCQSNS